MTPWPQAIASFYLSGGVLGLLLLSNLPDEGADTGSPVLVALCAVGLIFVVVVTVMRLVTHAQSVRRPYIARTREPIEEPVEPRRALAWAVVGAVGAALVVATGLIDARPVGLIVFGAGVVLVVLAYWFLWRAPLRPVSSSQDDRGDVTG